MSSILENIILPFSFIHISTNGKCDFTKPEICMNEKGRIIFSKIEDIPTRPDSPNLLENGNSHHLNDKDECNKKENTPTRLKFEINIPQKKISLPTQTQSTFAELSNRLGPTVNFNNRKLGINHNIKNPLLEPRERETKKENKEIKPKETNTIQIDVDETEDVVYLKSSKSKTRSSDIKRSRSRSYTYSPSRSRSYSYSSYSRSRSRSWSYSRSRSRSYSIQRRRGSPSFLDKRRITSARKRPIPYHRPTPSPTPSFSSRSSCSRSRSRSRGRCRSRS